MNPISVKYAVPNRQVWMLLGTAMLFVCGVVFAALTDPPLWGIALGAGCLGGCIWLAIRHIYGRGELSFTDQGLQIISQRPALCASNGPLQIAWVDCLNLQSGRDDATQPDPYVMIKTRSPKRTWILIPLSPDHADLGQEIQRLANAHRVAMAEPPLELIDAMSSIGWKIVTVAALVVGLLCLVGLIATGQSSDLSLWGATVTLNGLAISLWPRVFQKAK